MVKKETIGFHHVYIDEFFQNIFDQWNGWLIFQFDHSPVFGQLIDCDQNQKQKNLDESVFFQSCTVVQNKIILYKNSAACLIVRQLRKNEKFFITMVI